MLGKTNIVTTAESAATAEIEDYKWIAASAGDGQAFIKAAFGDSMLAAITADGGVTYSADGENWEWQSVGDYVFCDILWDGARFIIVGGHNEDGKDYGLIIITTDFTDLDVRTKCTDSDASNQYRFFGIAKVNNKYAVMVQQNGSSQQQLISWVGDLDTWDTKTVIRKVIRNGSFSWTAFHVELVRNTSGFMLYAKGTGNNSGYSHDVYTSSDGVVFNNQATLTSTSTNAINNWIKVMSLRDELYFMYLVNDQTYNIYKVLSAMDRVLVSTGINYQFVGGAYYDNTLVFINNHNMLLVKNNESLTDKALSDMFEISYDYSFNSIIKAFDKLYILCNQGYILMSDAEGKSSETTAVSTMSARRALFDAKKYTDEQLNGIRLEVTADEQLRLTIGEQSFLVSLTPEEGTD